MSNWRRRAPPGGSNQFPNPTTGVITMSRPRLSILVLTYNRERMLAECLDSLLPVQIPDCEILVFDDASTDGTPAVADEYAQRDSRVKYFRHQTNQGVFRN